MNSRQNRKLAHINHALSLADQLSESGLQDVLLVHNALPELSLSELELRTRLWGAECSVPLYINAITGGAPNVKNINKQLAKIAHHFGIPMAVGSQTAGLEDSSVLDSYQIVRSTNPTGIIWGNIGAHLTAHQALEAVKMIGANGLQIHLNVPQELVMAEGDRSFKGYLNNIQNICALVDVPVIVKEVGFGISRTVATKLIECGVSAIDVSGRGGTNFVQIEHSRTLSPLGNILSSWGISTVASLIEVTQTVSKLNKNISTFASGGIRTGLDCVKLLSLGANMIGIAKPVLKTLLSDNGYEKSIQLIDNLITELKASMLLVGAKSIAELQSIPVIIRGETKDWLEMRGYNLTDYSQRDLF